MTGGIQRGTWDSPVLVVSVSAITDFTSVLGGRPCNVASLEDILAGFQSFQGGKVVVVQGNG
jgi:hypothetical protein